MVRPGRSLLGEILTDAHPWPTQSHHPASTLSGLSFLGGIVGPSSLAPCPDPRPSQQRAETSRVRSGFSRTRSIPSLIGGLTLGSLFAVSALRIREGLDNGYEAAGPSPSP